MTLKDLGEVELIARLRARGLVRPEGVVKGIGDDAAVFRLGDRRLAVVTTDLLIEGVHFRLPRMDPRDLGAKALAVNLSDLAAMGARPREAFLGLAAAGTMAQATLEGFLDGFMEEARAHDVNLLGGDTSASPRGLVISVTLMGDVEEGQFVTRGGASAGDVVFVTGTLGDSAGGLLLLERGCEGDGVDRVALLKAHNRPRAYVREGEWLACSGAATAMIDLSDGLLRDLGHVLRESGGLGARIEADRLPLSPALRSACFELDEDPLDLALSGGEDYRLLVTVRPQAAAAIEESYQQRFGERLLRVGMVEAEAGLRLARGSRTETIEARGFEHWRS